MKSIYKILYGLTLCSLSALSYAATSNNISDPTITYKNEHGSILTLVWHQGSNNAGSLTGTFKSALGNCKADIGVPVPIVGYYNGNAMSATVNYPGCNLVVAMTGNLKDNNTNLQTLWIVTTQSQWNANTVGSDSFKKIS